MQWQWNHNPDDGKWSLFERPGFLRLYTASVTDDLMQARNTLTQRIFAFHNTKSPYGLDTSRPSIGTVALNLKHMQEGDMAGLTIQQDPYAYIAVHVKDGTHLGTGYVENGRWFRAGCGHGNLRVHRHSGLSALSIRLWHRQGTVLL